MSGDWRERQGPRARQAMVVAGLELRRMLFSRKAAGAWFLAVVPPLLVVLVTLASRNVDPIPRLPAVYAQIYRNLILQMVVYFGCAWIFSNAFRGEMLERSLHHTLLLPVRRETLAVGKYLAALAAAAMLFTFTTIATWAGLLLRQSPAMVREQVIAHGGLAQLGGWVALTLLACAGYGALFLLFGLLVKSPFIPALLLWGWERIHFVMPDFLQPFTLIHWLLALAPIHVDQGPLAVVTAAPPVWAAVPVILAVAGVFVTVAALRARRLEILYGGE